MHVFARRRSRADAAALGREYADLLAPLLPVGRADLDAGLAIFERMPALGAFDAVLAAAAANAGPEGLMSADAAFASIPGVAVLAPSEDTLIRLGA